MSLGWRLPSVCGACTPTLFPFLRPRPSPAQPPPYLRCVDAGSADFGSPACTDRRSSLWHTLGLPVAFYVAWQGAYFLKTEVWDAPRLRQDPSIQASASGGVRGAMLAWG